MTVYLAMFRCDNCGPIGDNVVESDGITGFNCRRCTGTAYFEPFEFSAENTPTLDPPRWLDVIDRALCGLVENQPELLTNELMVAHRIVHSILRGHLASESLMQPVLMPPVDNDIYTLSRK